MKKKMVAAAFGVAFSAASHAQSSVTLYGILDSGITYVSNQKGHSVVFEDSGINQPSRWGLTGAEDLGGGLKAIFTLESGILLNNGAARVAGEMFSRISTVGLSSKWGKLTLGRQYDFMSDMLLPDSSAAQFAGDYAFHFRDIDRIAGESVNNSVKLVSNPIAGVTVGAMYGFSNQAGAFGGTAGAPRYKSFGITYDSGSAFVIDAAYTDANGTIASAAEAAMQGTAVRNMGIGARYRLGSVLLFGNYTNNKVSGMPAVGSETVSVLEGGFNWRFTPSIYSGLGYIYNHYPIAQISQIATAIHYLFSKRTDVSLNVNFAHSNSDKQVAGLFQVVDPYTNQGYSTSRNQLAVSVGFRTKF
ncbi:porin [Paraburkholderia sp. C35]|uniref:porin n=1 Tax=Paraburkholderia sp. C35 TaxID=2126993 RepID=UPI000D694C4C|nr:porin [Paraburkholderia sp. C35]